MLRVEREGDHLTARFTGDRNASKLYARSDNEFAYGAAQDDARIAFGAQQAVLLQNGQETLMPGIDEQRAEHIETAVAQRVAAQSPNARSEAALRRLMSDVRAGRIDSSLLSPQLVGALNHDLPNFQTRLAELGPTVAMRLKQVTASGGDEYEVTHEQGMSVWGVVVDDRGVINSATIHF